MDKYIGFDIDDKKTAACIVQEGKKDIYDTIETDPAVMKQWRGKIQHRRKLVDSSTQTKNRIRTLVRTCCGKRLMSFPRRRESSISTPKPH